MKVTKAVILAAGKGTRFLPYTKTQPKEMLAVVDKPALQLLVEEVASSGISDVLVVMSKQKDSAIKRYFDVDTDLEQNLSVQGKDSQLKSVQKLRNLANISFAYQDEVSGTANAVLLAKDFVGNEPFAVLNGDDVILSDIPVTKQLIDAYAKCNNTVVGVQDVPAEDICKYASCSVTQLDGRLLRLLDVCEKPSYFQVMQIQSLFAPLGRYVLTSEIFDAIANLPQHGGESYLTDAIRQIALQGNAYAYNFVGKRFDFGDVFGYVKGFTEFALADERFAKQYRKYLTELLKK